MMKEAARCRGCATVAWYMIALSYDSRDGFERNWPRTRVRQGSAFGLEMSHMYAKARAPRNRAGAGDPRPPLGCATETAQPRFRGPGYQAAGYTVPLRPHSA